MCDSVRLLYLLTYSISGSSVAAPGSTRQYYRSLLPDGGIRQSVALSLVPFWYPSRVPIACRRLGFATHYNLVRVTVGR